MLKSETMLETHLPVEKDQLCSVEKNTCHFVKLGRNALV